MRAFVIACGLVAANAVSAHAGAFIEGAFAFAARTSSNYNTPFDPPFSNGPTYTLVPTSQGGGISPLSASLDTRGTGFFSDSALKFALGSVVPAGQSIVAAKLTFNVQGSVILATGNPFLALSGFRADANAVSLADFSLPTTDLASTPLLGNSGFSRPTLPPFVFDVTSYLQSLQSLNATSVGFRFENGSQGNVSISAPNDPNSALQPRLVITYEATVPEPASVAMATLGLGIMLVAARRRGNLKTASV